MSSTRLVSFSAVMEGIDVHIHQGCISEAAGLVGVSPFFESIVADCR